MRIVCVGGGPAGLYFAISAKRRDAGHEITIIDRDPPGATYGWGVVYWDNLLDVLFRNDPDSAREIRGASTLWQEQDISLGGERAAHFAGYGFSVQRAALLDILTRRAEELGVRVEHDREVADLTDLTDLADLGCLGGLGAHADADLVIAADGANSQVRSMFADRFGTRVDTGGNRYIWLGTPRRFERFTFAFEPTPAGWVWFHAYPSGAEVSTCIVECAPRTWDALGLGTDDGEGLRLLGKIFAGPLAGEGLIDQLRRPARWQRFGQVSNRSWYWDNMVLLGDAAHTTHFTLGSGTALAMMDGVMLAQMLYEHGEVPVALAEFDRAGRAALAPLQARARTSMAWFERIDGQLDRARPATGGDPDPVAFAYAMATRQGDQPPWRYQAHRAMQVGAVRRLRREVDSSVRWYLARRRGEPARPGGRPAPAGTPTPAGPAGRALAGAGSGSAAHRSHG